MRRLFLSIFAASVPFLVLATVGCGDKKAAPEVADLAAEAKANNDFAVDLFEQLRLDAKPDQNIVFSPYSIRTALAMVYAGARGETAEEMAKVLRFGRDKEKYIPQFAAHSAQLTNQSDGLKCLFKIANGAFCDARLNVKSEYATTLNERFTSAFKTVDFANDPNGARKSINSWIAENTEGRINEALPPGSIKRTTMLALANAVYFKATWRHPMTQIANRSFTLPSGAKSSPPMIYVENEFRYGLFDEFEVVELPYYGDKFAMIAALPKSNSVSAPSSASKLLSYLDALKPQQLKVRMPKLTLETSAELSGNLGRLGMKSTLNGADFGDISPSLQSISSIEHHAKLEVDEIGTVASASTVVQMTGIMTSSIKSLTFDRAYYLALIDKESKLILFLAWVAAP